MPPESVLFVYESNVGGGVSALSTTSVQFTQKSTPAGSFHRLSVFDAKLSGKQGSSYAEA